MRAGGVWRVRHDGHAGAPWRKQRAAAKGESVPKGKGEGREGRMSRTADSVLLCFGFASPRLLSQVRDLTRCSACPRKRVCPRQPEKIPVFRKKMCKKKIRDVRTHSTCGGQAGQHRTARHRPFHINLHFGSFLTAFFRPNETLSVPFFFLRVAARRDRVEPANPRPSDPTETASCSAVQCSAARHCGQRVGNASAARSSAVQHLHAL